MDILLETFWFLAENPSILLEVLLDCLDSPSLLYLLSVFGVLLLFAFGVLLFAFEVLLFVLRIFIFDEFLLF